MHMFFCAFRLHFFIIITRNPPIPIFLANYLLPPTSFPHEKMYSLYVFNAFLELSGNDI